MEKGSEALFVIFALFHYVYPSHLVAVESGLFCQIHSNSEYLHTSGIMLKYYLHIKFEGVNWYEAHKCSECNEM